MQSNQLPSSLSPDHASTLLELLQASCSPDSNHNRLALQTIELWEQIPGYCSLLHMIINNKQIDDNLRFIAISCFKNAVHKYWQLRNSKSICISEEEKNNIKVKLKELLNEQNNLNAFHIALLYAKIARNDFPSKWPNAIQDLLIIEQNDNESQLVKLRALETLKFTIKAQSSKVLHLSRIQFKKITPEVLQLVAFIWVSTNKQILSVLEQLQGNSTISNDFIAILEACKLSLQTISPLLQYGIENINQNQTATELLSVLLVSLKTYSQYVKTKLPEQIQKYIQKYITSSYNIIVNLHKSNPGAFEVFVIPYLEFTWTEISNLSLEESNKHSFLGKIIVSCFKYIKDVIVIHFPSGANLKKQLSEEEKRIQINVKELFTTQRITQLTELLISKYFKLSLNDLELWQNDPEEFLSDVASDDYLYKVRATAESLYCICQAKFDDIIAPHIIQLLKSVAKKNNETLDNALLRESCYLALGISYDRSFSKIPFSNWLNEFLLPDIQHSNRQCFMVLSRRISWLFGQWVTMLCNETRPIIYQILLKLMEDSDLVIKITASDGLSTVIDDLNFNIEPFEEYIPTFISHIFTLINNVQETSLKMKLINHLGVIIEQGHSKILPYSQQILIHLTKLWNNIKSEDLGMLRNSLIRTIDKLVTALEYRICDYYDIIIPIIKMSTDVTQYESIYTIEDGMDTWLKILQQAPQSHPSFLILFDNLPMIIQNSFEFVSSGINILDCYILLGGEFLQKHGKDLVALYNILLGDLNEQGTSFVINNMKLLVKCYPNEAPQFLEDMLIKVIGLLFTPNEPELCKKEYALLLIRVILSNSSYFIQLLHKIQQVHQTDILSKFLDYIFEMIEIERDVTIRRKIAFAVCEIIPIGESVIQRLPQIIDLILNVLEDKLADSYTDIYEEDSDDEEDPAGSLINERKYQLYKKDNILMKKDLKGYIILKIQQGIEIHGDIFKQGLSKVHPTLLGQLQNK